MGKTYTAGELDQRIIIESRATTSGATQNSLGENTSTWAAFATVWAKAAPIRGREFFAQGQQQQTIEALFVIRYRADVTPSMRILWRGSYYDIASVIHVDGGLTWLELMTVTGAHDGQ